MKYKVMWDYQSSLGGPWMKGDVVEMGEELAADVNRDSPGVLQLVGSDTPLKRDRMVRTRKDRGGGEGPITKADFQAVVKK